MIERFVCMFCSLLTIFSSNFYFSILFQKRHQCCSAREPLIVSNEIYTSRSLPIESVLSWSTGLGPKPEF